MNNEISELAAQCVNKLIEKNITIATAESCTGGMFSSYLTNVPGVSAIYEFGITSYSNRIKSRVLGVDAETLMEYGAVSHQTAKEMAIKIRKLAPANIGVSITGEAGPSSSEGKAPGTVYIAISDENMTAVVLIST